MKVLLLADPDSVHTIRWARSLVDRGIDIAVFGFNGFSLKNFESTAVKVYGCGIDHRGLFNKLRYVLTLHKLKKVITEFQPDILHAHYASSYGLIGRLSGFKPFLISVWGSDIFDFPNRSFLHRRILKVNLQKATKIFSTSKVMAVETLKVMQQERHIEIIPFGIDLTRFVPKMVRDDTARKIVIGTVKTLSFNYGIDVLIEAFHVLSTRIQQVDLCLVIGGEGEDREYFESLVKKYKIANRVKFLGKIEHDNVPKVLSSFDIFAALSNSESFGVSVIEASACGLPTVVTNVGGLPEVVVDHQTGLVVPAKDPQAAAAAFEELIANTELRLNMGLRGRDRVKRHYDWKVNVSEMVLQYETVIGNNKATSE